jgi:hypothetical protein
VLQQVGPFEHVSFGTDWLMWLRIAAAGYEVGYLPDVLTEYGPWYGDWGRFCDAACAVFDAYGDRRSRAWWRLLAAEDAREHGDRQGARRRILQASRIRPTSIRPGWIKAAVAYVRGHGWAVRAATRPCGMFA